MNVLYKYKEPNIFFYKRRPIIHFNDDLGFVLRMEKFNSNYIFLLRKAISNFGIFYHLSIKTNIINS